MAIPALSEDRRFATAYNAALQTAKMAIACAGYVAPTRSSLARFLHQALSERLFCMPTTTASQSIPSNGPLLLLLRLYATGRFKKAGRLSRFRNQAHRTILMEVVRAGCSRR